MAAVPVLARVRDRVADAPTATDPKLRLPGDIPSDDCTPTPLNGTMRGSPVAEPAIESAPLNAPVSNGRKLTCTVQLAPAASVPPAVGHDPTTTL
jgi:hypothetical protein